MITLVVAMDKKRGIGARNQLLWHLPADLKHFKNVTSGHPVIMGRKTYESIGKALPNRTNIVVSSRKDWFEEGILIVGNLKEALKFARKIDDEIFIIGGGNIYEQTIGVADKLEVTEVDGIFDAEVFFPEIDPAKWKLSAENCREKDEKNSYNICFRTYVRDEVSAPTGQ